MSEAAPASPEFRRIDTQSEYEAATDEVIGKAAHRLRVFDRTLSRRYNTPERIELLRTFLRANRMNRLEIVLHDTDAIVRDLPRLVLLTQQFSHAIVIRRTRPRARHAQDAIVIADEVHHLHRFHCDHPRAAVAFDDPLGTADLARRFEEILESSDVAVTGTRLGL